MALKIHFSARLAVLCLTAGLLLSGCSYTQTGVDALLKPPKLSEEQNEIYTALVSGTSKGIRMIYPRKGEFTSAFLVDNLDSEPTDEALVFYEQASGGGMVMRINVLDQKDGRWYSTYDAGGAPSATEVEKVNIITVNHQKYLIVGYNITSSTDKTCILYAFEDGKLSEKQRWSCSNYIVYDLDEDRVPELLTITNKKDASGSGSSVADLRRITNTGGSQTISSAELDPDVTEYKYITSGKLKDGRSALYLDGLRGANLYSTEILACDGQRMENLIYSSQGVNLIEKTLRPSGTPCVDINGDGIIEIPVRRAAPGYENSERHQQEFFTEWYVYDDEKLELRKTTYAAYSLGYVFMLPEDWLGKVTIGFDSNQNELTFYAYTPGRDLTDKLASIKVVRAAEYQAESADKGYKLLYDNGQIMYAYMVYTKASGSIRVTPQRIENGFQLYKPL